MDSAYDHIAEETLTGDRAPTPTPPQAGPTATTTASTTRPNLNTEFQETFRAFSHSPWATTLGGLWGNVCKQGESYYEGARREVGEASGEALKGFTDLKDSLVSRTRSLSLGEADRAKAHSTTSDGGASTPTASDTHEGKVEGFVKERTESEILRDNDSLIARFRSEAAKRLKDIEKAEDAADEALLRFGTNIRNFLRDAVAIAPPSEDDTTATQSGGDFLFESKDASGKRAIHTTRFDAQLHVIHITLNSFMQDPVSDEWPLFKKDFTIDQKTGDISRDLDKYPELRHTMEQLVPEKVEYMDFWRRYYFLRMIVDTQEKERKELLKGAASSQNADDEIGWDEDSEDEQSPPTPQGKKANTTAITMEDKDSATTTLQPPPVAVVEPLKSEARRSHDRQSQPDSDASYDLVSGATSHAPGSPKDEKPKDIVATKDEETDEEDWE